MGYVLVRVEDGKMVGMPGAVKSYTSDPAEARVWPTREAALADACGNERVVDADSIFSR